MILEGPEHFSIPFHNVSSSGIANNYVFDTIFLEVSFLSHLRINAYAFVYACAYPSCGDQIVGVLSMRAGTVSFDKE